MGCLSCTSTVVSLEVKYEPEVKYLEFPQPRSHFDHGKNELRRNASTSCVLRTFYKEKCVDESCKNQKVPKTRVISIRARSACLVARSVPLTMSFNFAEASYWVFFI